MIVTGSRAGRVLRLVDLADSQLSSATSDPIQGLL